MMDSAPLQAYLCARQPAVPVQLWIDRCAQPGPARAGTSPAAVLASSAYLAIVPAGCPDGDLCVPELLAFARDFSIFPAYQRKWRWSAALAAQLDACLAALEAGLPDAPAGYGFLYLNGQFQKKYLPDGRVAAPGYVPPARQGQYRGATPRLEHILRVFGTASLLDTTLGASPGHDSFHCYSAHDRVVGIGRGHSDQQMMRGAVFEFCERWASSAVPPDVVYASHDALSASGVLALRPDQLDGVAEADSVTLHPGFARSRRMGWTGAWRHGDGAAPERALVPLPMVNYLLPQPDPFAFTRNSNGCALGNSPEEAALFGALEVIERDALLLTWYSKSRPPRLRIDTAIDALVEMAAGVPPGQGSLLATAELLHLLQGAGYEVACFDIGLEWRVPTVLVVLLGKSTRQMGAFVTAASHPEAGQALHAALAEAWSLLGSAQRNVARHAALAARRGTGLDHLREEGQALYYADWRQRHHFDFLAQAPQTVEVEDFLAMAAAPGADPAPAWQALKLRARQLGYTMVVADNTPQALARLGLYSARVFIPGAIPLTFGDHPVGIPHGRLARAAAACGWVDRHANLAAPQLHPLG